MMTFWSDERGVIALKFALALPALAVLGAGAIDLRAVALQRAEFQTIAEISALAGARELSLAVGDEVSKSRAQSYASALLSEYPGAAVRTAVESLAGSRILNVEISDRRASFFGNLLPPGGWVVRAEAAASSVGRTPLCVIGSGRRSRGTLQVIDIADDGVIDAPDCLIHSNHDINAGAGRISAGMVQAVASAEGAIMPAANIGAVALDDPFRDVSIPADQPCSPSRAATMITTGFHTLAAGVHCGAYRISGDADVTLAPGEHYFVKGNLTVTDDARLHGEDTALIFDGTSSAGFTGRARIELNGRRSGALAGFVLVTTRDNVGSFVIDSDHVDQLLGVLYIPAARLLIEGGRDIAKSSDWTVIVADAIELRGSPSLFINANYAASDVPVPDGVGPSKGGSRLVR